MRLFLPLAILLPALALTTMGCPQGPGGVIGDDDDAADDDDATDLDHTLETKAHILELPDQSSKSCNCMQRIDHHRSPSSDVSHKKKNDFSMQARLVHSKVTVHDRRPLASHGRHVFACMTQRNV